MTYHFRTGNTRKLAESMAGDLGVKAGEIAGSSIADPADMLFIGDGTYGGQKKAVTDMEELLKGQGINVLDKSSGFRGRNWTIMNMQGACPKYKTEMMDRVPGI